MGEKPDKNLAWFKEQQKLYTKKVHYFNQLRNHLERSGSPLVLIKKLYSNCNKKKIIKKL